MRGYPVGEAHDLVFVFPGHAEKAAVTELPFLPVFGSAKYKTMAFSRTVRCHYSFMHENLLDMNHQLKPPISPGKRPAQDGTLQVTTG